MKAMERRLLSRVALGVAMLFANTQAMASSYKPELMSGIHAHGTTVVRGSTAADTFKMALYLASATTNGSNTAYTATGEVSGTGYSAGGVTVTNATAPSLSGTTGIWTPSANVVYSTVTLSTSFDAAMLYNSTQGNKAVGVFTFGATTITAGNLTLAMPANGASTALVRIA